MKVKGSKPVAVENTPDGMIMFQASFRVGDTIYNQQITGPLDVLMADKRARDAIVRRGFLNVVWNNAGGALKTSNIDLGLDDVELAAPGEIAALDPESKLVIG